MKRTIIALSTTLIYMATATLAEERYEFYLSKGSGTSVCEAVLIAAQAAPADFVGQCEMPRPDSPEDPPVEFINWSVLRERLGPQFRVPKWRRLDLNDPADLESAMFARAVQSGHKLAENHMDGKWTAVFSDEEIMELVRRYNREGGLPKEILLYPSLLDKDHIEETTKVYETSFDYGSFSNRAIMTEFFSDIQPNTCFSIIDADPLRDIILYEEVVRFAEGYRNVIRGPKSRGRDDIFVYNGVLYGVRYDNGGTNTHPHNLAISPYIQHGDYNEYGSSICELSVRNRKEDQ